MDTYGGSLTCTILNGGHTKKPFNDKRYSIE